MEDTERLPEDLLRHMIQTGLFNGSEEGIATIGCLSLVNKHWRCTAWSNVRLFSNLPSCDESVSIPSSFLFKSLYRLTSLDVLVPSNLAASLIRLNAASLESLCIQLDESGPSVLSLLSNCGPLSKLQRFSLLSHRIVSEAEQSPIVDWLASVNPQNLRRVHFMGIGAAPELLDAITARCAGLKEICLMGARSQLLELHSASRDSIVRWLNSKVKGPPSGSQLEVVGLHASMTGDLLAPLFKLCKSLRMGSDYLEMSPTLSQFEAEVQKLLEIPFFRQATSLGDPNFPRVKFFINSVVPDLHYGTSANFLQGFEAVGLLGLLLPFKLHPAALQIVSERSLLRGSHSNGPSKPILRLSVPSLDPLLQLARLLHPEDSDDLVNLAFDVVSQHTTCKGGSQDLIQAAFSSGNLTLVKRVLAFSTPESIASASLERILYALTTTKPNRAIDLFNLAFDMFKNAPASVNEEGITPTMAAVVSMQPPELAVEILRFLLTRSSEFQYLLDPNALSFSGESALHFLLSENLPSSATFAVVDLFLASSLQITPQLLLTACPDGISLLTHAIRHKHATLVARLEDSLTSASPDQRRVILGHRLRDLCSQAYEGSIVEFQQLISRGADVNAAAAAGWTPLMVLCEQTQVDIRQKVGLLIDAGARVDVRASGVSALDLLCSRSTLDVNAKKSICYLVEKLEAVNRSDVIAEALAHLIANFSRSSIWQSTFDEFAKRLFSVTPSDPLFQKALSIFMWALCGLPTEMDASLKEMLARLLDAGVDPNFSHALFDSSDKQSILSRSLSNGDTGLQLARFLLSRHASPWLRDGTLEKSRARCPLAKLIHLHHDKIEDEGANILVEFLVSCPAPLDIQCLDNCITVLFDLFKSVRNFGSVFLPALQILLEHSPTLIGTYRSLLNGDNILHLCVQSSKPALLQLIFDNFGANLVEAPLLTAPNDEGLSSLQLACALEHVDTNVSLQMLSLLLEFACDLGMDINGIKTGLQTFAAQHKLNESALHLLTIKAARPKRVRAAKANGGPQRKRRKL